MIKQKLKIIIQFVSNPRLLLCLGIGWMITNGWAYLLFAAGSYFEIPWILAIASTYLAFLWFPFTLEKLVTFAIAIVLMRRWFPQDTKTLGVFFRNRVAHPFIPLRGRIAMQSHRRVLLYVA